LLFALIRDRSRSNRAVEFHIGTPLFRCPGSSNFPPK
jgi:hypothetical protein